jgi:DNA-binding transcriptional MerR regulator
MNRFTIKDIENLSGIKAHTWRIWEHRHGINMAQRKDSNHRFYTNSNLKEILRIAYLYHRGIKISKIAQLDEDAVKTLALERQLAENGNEFYIKELLEASLDLDEERFERAFGEAIKRMGVEDAILKVLYPFQERIGVLWLTDHVIPAQEHFTSNIIRQKLAIAIDALPPVPETHKKEILLFTPKQEFHELPLQFICYLLRKNRNKVSYFGCNVPLTAIEEYNKTASFSYLYFHVVTNLTGISADEYLNQISTKFPDKQIVMSGTQILQVTHVPNNVRLLHSMSEVLDFVKE